MTDDPEMQALTLIDLAERLARGEIDAAQYQGAVGRLGGHAPTELPEEADAPSLPTPDVPAAGMSAGDSHAYASWMANILNALELLGQDVEDIASDADDELDGSGWNVARNPSGHWSAVRDDAELASLALGESFDIWALLEAGGERAPKGGITIAGKEYKGGRFIPAAVMASASPEDKQRLEQAKANAAVKAEKKTAARHERGSIDTGKLASRLQSHADQHPLSSDEKRWAASAARMLHRHHGAMTAHRIEELADRLDRALHEVGDDHPNSEGLRSYFGRQLAKLHQALGHAKDKGVTGEVVRAAGQPAAGEVYALPDTAPVMKGERLKVFGVQDGKVQIGLEGHKVPSASMPVESWAMFKEDMEGKPVLPPSDDPAVESVRAGKGELLGKGDDGLAFKVGDDVVKLSTTSPLIPTNDRHRSPEQAADMLRRQTATSREAAAAGVPGILPVRGVEAGSRHAQVRPYVDAVDALSADQMRQTEGMLKAMHAAGYSLGDLPQMGTMGGKLYFFDTGKMARLPDDPEGRERAIDSDLAGLGAVARKSGLDYEPPAKPGQSPSDPLSIRKGTLKRRWEKIRDEVQAKGGSQMSPALAGNIAAARILNATRARAAAFRDEIDRKARADEHITPREEEFYDRINAGEFNFQDDLVKLSGYRPYPDLDEHPLAQASHGSLEAGFTGTDAQGRQWQDGKLVAKQEEPAKDASRDATDVPADVQELSPQPPEPGFTGIDSLGRRWENGRLVAKQEEAPTNATGTGPVDAGTGSGQRRPDVGGDGGGLSGGALVTLPPARERIVTARADLVKPADPALVPEGLRQHLDEHQVQGAAHAIRALDAHGGFLLADGTGTGKTRQQLAIAAKYAAEGKKVLIVTKAEVIKPDWGKGKVTGSFASDSTTMGVSLALNKGDQPIGNGQVHVTTYDRLAEIKGKVDKDTVLIFDESHSLKNWGSARSKHGYEMSKAAGAVMYATATPADKPLHIAHLFRAKVFGTGKWEETYRELGMRQVDVRTPQGTIQKWEIDPKVGYAESLRRMSGLFDRMIEDGLMLKREISLQGVDIGVDRIELSPEAHEALARVEKAMAGADMRQVMSDLKDRIYAHKRQFDDLMRDAHGMEQGDAGYDIKDRPATLEKAKKVWAKRHALEAELETLQSVSGSGMNEGLRRAQLLMHQRRQQEPYKVPHAVGMASKEIAEGRQVVIFVSRVNESTVGKGDDAVGSEGTTKVLREALAEAGIHDVAELHGGVTPKARQRAVEDFQAGKSRVIIATGESGGTGINLDDSKGTAPRTLIDITPSFSAVDNVQKAGRVHRLKTQSASRIRYLFGNTDVDDWNSRLIAGKMKTLGAVVGGEVGKLDVSSLGVSAEGEEDLADERPTVTGAEPYKWRPLVRSVTPPVQPPVQPPPTVTAGAKQTGQSSRRKIATRRVSTSRGERTVHAFVPNESFWAARKAGKVPENVTVRKNDRTGQWEASVWGADDDEIHATLERLRSRGVRLPEGRSAGSFLREQDRIILRAEIRHLEDRGALTHAGRLRQQFRERFDCEPLV